MSASTVWPSVRIPAVFAIFCIVLFASLACFMEKPEQRLELALPLAQVGAQLSEIGADGIALERSLLADVLDMLQDAGDAPEHVGRARPERDNDHRRDEKE